VRRHKGFPKETLGAGGIQFRRAGEIKKGQGFYFSGQNPTGRKKWWGDGGNT